MNTIPLHSTRLQGWHLRRYRAAGGEETECFEADLYHGESHAGRAYNGGTGGPDIAHVDGAHREAWRAFMAYANGLAFYRDGDGEPGRAGVEEENAVRMLKDIRWAENALRRSRNASSGLLVYRWTERWGSFFARATLWSTPAGAIDPEHPGPEFFWILPLGADAPRLLRETAPPVGTAAG